MITRPEHDPGLRYLSAWSSKIIEVAEEKGFEVIDLKDKKVTKSEFEGRILKTKPDVVILNGHGSADSVTGHDNEELVRSGDNDHLLKNRITYAVSCDSAADLGKKCGDSTTAYIGYDQKFIFSIDSRYLNRPLEDMRAQRFLEPSNHVAISLLKNHTAKESSDRSKEASLRTIRSLLTSNHMDPDSLDDAKDIYWNMKHQVCLGAEDARI